MRSILLLLLTALCLFTDLSAQHYETMILTAGKKGRIGKWETIEIGLRIPEQERSYRTFLDDHSRGINPYSNHLLRMQFTCHGKNYYANAFYLEDASPDELQNKYVSRQAQWPWRIRFAVPDTGTWSCILLVGDDKDHATPVSTGLKFQSITSDSHGFLRIEDDHRHLVYSDYTPFFIIGQNIAWTYTPELRGKAGKFPQYICGYYDVYHYINDLADNGGNFFRIVMSPWSTGIESETGVYDQARSCALDSMMHIAEERGLHVQLALDLSLGFDKAASEQDKHPYRKSFQKPGQTASEMLRDSAVLNAFDNYFRYVYARWAFSPTVANIEMMCEQFHWEGYDGREENFNAFFEHMQKLLREELCDSTHLLSSSQLERYVTSTFHAKGYDYIDIHQYSNNYSANEDRYDLVNRRSVRNLDKPFMFGEMGTMNGPGNGCDANDIEYCSDISFHNALWATTFMGAMGTGLYWWQWENDGFRKENFPALRFFIDSIAGRMDQYIDYRLWTGNGLENFYSLNESGTKGVGWAHNRSYWWANTTDSCVDRNGLHMMHPRDEDKADKPVARTGNSFVIAGLQPRRTYLISLYSTREPGQLITSIVLNSSMLGKIKVEYPGEKDVCFRLKMAGKR